MNSPSVRRGYHDEDDAIFLEDDDIVEEIFLDNEDLPDVEGDEDSDGDPIDETDDSIHGSMVADETDDSIHKFTGHTRELYTVACSPVDATLVATGGRDHKGFVWRIFQDQDSAFELQGHKNSVSSLAFSKDGQLLASGSFDGYIQVWDTSSGDVNFKCKLEGPAKGIEWVRWHPIDHLILAGSEDSTVWMWDVDEGTPPSIFAGHDASVICGDFTPDGRFICTGSDDTTLRIRSTENAEINHVVRDYVSSDGHRYHTEGLTCLSVSPDSVLALTGSKDGSVHAVQISTGRVVKSLIAHTDSVECVSFAASSSWAATGGMDGKLFIYEMQDSSPRWTCEHEEGVTCLLWLGAASIYVATGSVDGKVRIWDRRSGDCVKILSGHANVVQSLAISSDGDRLVSAALDQTACVFEIAEFK